MLDSKGRVRARADTIKLIASGVITALSFNSITRAQASACRKRTCFADAAISSSMNMWQFAMAINRVASAVPSRSEFVSIILERTSPPSSDTMRRARSLTVANDKLPARGRWSACNNAGPAARSIPPVLRHSECRRPHSHLQSRYIRPYREVPAACWPDLSAACRSVRAEFFLWVALKRI